MKQSEEQRSRQSLRWAATLAFIVLGIVLAQPGTAQGQWATNGNNINNTNPGNVGIGTSSPAATLDINGFVRAKVTDAVTNGISVAAMVEHATTGTPANGIGARLYFSAPNNSGLMLSAGDIDVSVADGVANHTDMVFRLMQGGVGDTEMMRIKGATGTVGVGTSSPGYEFHVYKNTANTSADVAVQNGDTSGSGSAFSSFRMLNDDSGASLLFRYSPAYTGSATYKGNLTLRNTGNGSVGGAINFETGVSTAASRMFIDINGNVGIGTTSPGHTLEVVGTANFSGAVTGSNISATYQDVAEWVPASKAIAAGSVVVLDSSQSNHVLSSTKAYDTRVAGVISARPGVSLGVGGEGKVLVATTGRVKVKVDATRSPIRVGDLLVTSDKEGMAMRSEPVNIGGVEIHRPGTLIGKALEPLEKGTGEILVLLSLQ